ncbi:MAG: hypothetical protein II702_06765 [Clostridia bacterium]|jgi:hypothetical protein|nr:hypothetical protein [Clostridia bacterium]
MNKNIFEIRTRTAVGARFEAVSPFSKELSKATLIRSCRKTGFLPEVNVNYAIMFEDEKKPLFISSSQYRRIRKSGNKTETANSIAHDIVVEGLKKTRGGREWIKEYESALKKTPEFHNILNEGIA